MKKTAVITIKILTFFIGWALLSGIIDIPSDNPVTWRLLAEMLPFAVVVCFTIIFLVLEKGEVRIPVIKNCGKGFLVGTILGVFWIGVSAGFLLLSHHLIVVEKNEVKQIWIWIFAAFINGIMQELLVRGYIYQLLKAQYNMIVAMVVTTAIFTFLHGGAFEAGIIPVINVITMSLFVTALYELERTIIAPIMAHAIWNITGAIILGGVSLADDYPSIYNLTASGNTLVSGGDYMIEASLVVTVLNILLTFLLLYRFRNNRHNI